MMEETSIISGATTNHSGDISDSNSSSTLHSGHHHTPSKFKGVVVQPNGHWGTQIYANHECIWLGTFKSKREAAAAYDSASIKLSGSMYHRNFPWTELTLHEPGFQSQLSTEAVIGMIKDGSYAARFADYVRAHKKQTFHSQVVTLHQGLGGGEANLRLLFQKELTPSDVGKLNRLVIPKKHALKYFPRIPDSKANNDRGGGDVEDLELVFYDPWMRSWKVRYCYWKSSQSFVFTRGWNRFAKEKGLKAKDRVIFSSYESGEQKMFIIDVGYCEGGISRSGFDGGSEETMDLESDHANDDDIGDTKENVVSGSTVDPGKKGFRLFGFQIV